MQTSDPMNEAREPKADPVTLEVFRHLFTALAEEMGAALRRSAFSPNIKERRDYSCALFSPEGVVVAQGDHMPVHLGAMPMSVAAILQKLGPLRQGDVACLNDPFLGGTHLPDITLVSPVYAPGEGGLLGYVATRAHHSDVGGSTPGSMPLAREIFQEGLRIPPVLLRREGVVDDGILDLVLANVRTPEERRGDLDAQVAALHTGERRLREMARNRGSEEVRSAMDGLLAYADRLLRAGLAEIPDGRYEASDTLEDDGFGSGRVSVRATVLVQGGRAEVDFRGSSDQTPGGINAVAAITTSATHYVFRVVVEDLLGLPLPAGGGAMSPVEIRLPERSIVNAAPPAAVAAGNVETSQRITDVLLSAFAQALPDRVPALSQGTMNNVALGGVDPTTGRSFTYYETAGGGMGGGPRGHGLSGLHSHMTNSLNTPVEALEHAYPLRVLRYGLRRGSGGQGKHRGGDGIQRDLQFLAPARLTLLTERRLEGPPGARGGGAGAPGRNVLHSQGDATDLPGKATVQVASGDVLSLRTPGGGGWGPVDEATGPAKEALSPSENTDPNTGRP